MTHVFDVVPMIVGLTLWPAIFFWAVVFAIFLEAAIFDTGATASATLILALAGSWFLHFWSIDFVVANKAAFLWLLAFYLPIGLLWATAKWWLYCHNLANKIRDYIQQRQRSGQLTPSITHFGQMPPQVGNHKADLIRWFSWWPFSMIGSLFDDFLRRICLAIYNAFANFWQRIADHAFAGIDLPK